MKRMTWGAALPAVVLVGLTAYVATAQDAEQEATLVVLVPATATVEIEGVKTTSTGELRRFRSPPLKVGKNYTYTIKATFTVDGQPKTVTKQVKVTAGTETTVDLRTDTPTPEPTKPATKPEPTKPEPTKPATKPEPTKPTPEPTKPATKPEPTKPATKPEATKPATKPEPTKPTPEPTKPATKPEPRKKEPKSVKLDKTTDELLKLGGVKKGDIVIDLGAGDGTLVAGAVGNYKAGKAWALEADEEKAKAAEKMAKDNDADEAVAVMKGDPTAIKEADLAKATVVFVRLAPDDATKMVPALKKLKKGTRIVVYDADLGEEWKAKDTKPLGTDADGVDHEAKLYEAPGE